VATNDTEVRIFSVEGALDDLLTLLDDVPMGTTSDFDIDVDPDDDLIEPSEGSSVTVDAEDHLGDLEALSVWHILRDQLGVKWWQQDTKALCDLLDEQFSLSQADRDLVASLQLLEVGNGFWCEWEIFNWICQGLLGNGVAFNAFPVLHPIDMAYAMLVAQIIDQANVKTGVYKEERTYQGEVLTYMAVTCMDSGLWALPFPLSVAQERVKELIKDRSTDIPINQATSIPSMTTRPTDVRQAIQWDRCPQMATNLLGSLIESKRELLSYKRVPS
jgi:hypothetical protein